MPKVISDTVFDTMLDYIRQNAKRVGVVSTTIPSTISSASSLLLAVTTCSSGSFTISDGDVSGRKLSVSAFSSIAVASTGTAGHVILFTTGATAAIVAGTSCTTQVLGSTSNTVSLSTWKIEVADPT